MRKQRRPTELSKALRHPHKSSVLEKVDLYTVPFPSRTELRFPDLLHHHDALEETNFPREGFTARSDKSPLRGAILSSPTSRASKIVRLLPHPALQTRTPATLYTPPLARGKFWSISPRRWARSPRQKTYHHMSQIMEGGFGTKSNSPCAECTGKGYDCWVYRQDHHSSDAREVVQACARCLWRGVSCSPSAATVEERLSDPMEQNLGRETCERLGA